MNQLEQESERHTDPVFLGLTRPTTVWGVPQGYFVFTLLTTMLGFLWTHAFKAFVIFPVLLGFGYLACIRDIRTFDILLIRARFARCMNAGFWRARSYDPFR